MANLRGLDLVNEETEKEPEMGSVRIINVPNKKEP